VNGLLCEDVVSIRLHNIKKLLTAIRFNDSLTKRDIASQTGLSIATITNLCNELISKNVISEGNYTAETRIGRTPNLMKFLYNSFYVLALDFQFENTVGIAVVNLRNELCFSDSLRISPSLSVGEILNIAKARFDQVVESMGINDQIIGVGASIPGVYDRNNGLVKLSSIASYQGIPLKRMLSETFKRPAYVDNCASIRAISAYARHPSPSIICLDVSQGVGCGVIIDGDVLAGKNGYATEIAHIPIGDQRRRCPTCGSYGCVESDLNIENIISHYSEIDDALPLPEKWAQCVSILKENPMKMSEHLDFWGSLLGQTASILINLFDPNDFYVTGFITDIFPLLADSFWRELRGRSSEAIANGLQVSIEACSWSDVYIGISDAMYHRWLP